MSDSAIQTLKDPRQRFRLDIADYLQIYRSLSRDTSCLEVCVYDISTHSRKIIPIATNTSDYIWNTLKAKKCVYNDIRNAFETKFMPLYASLNRLCHYD